MNCDDMFSPKSAITKWIPHIYNSKYADYTKYLSNEPTLQSSETKHIVFPLDT